MYTRVFEVDTSGQKSPSTNQRVNKEDQNLSEQAVQGSRNIGIEGTSPHHGIDPQKAKSRYKSQTQGGLFFF